MKDRAMIVFLVLALGGGPISQASGQNSLGYSVEEFLGMTIFREVSVSPDGQHIAFVASSDNFHQDREDVAVWRIDIGTGGETGSPVRLTYEPGNYFNLRWSSDGQFLAFLSTRKPAEAPQIYVLDVRGGEPVLVTDHLRFKQGIIAFDWAGKTKSLVFAARHTMTSEQEKAWKEFYGDAQRFSVGPPRTTFYRLELVSLVHPSVQPLATVTGAVRGLTVSPDGEWVGFRSGPSPDFFDGFVNEEVFLLSTTGRVPPRQVTRNFVAEDSLSWARVGSGLFASGLGEPSAKHSIWTQGRLFKIGLDTGAVQNLMPGFGGSLGSYQQLPDGSLLATALISTSMSICHINPQNGQLRMLKTFRGSVSHLSTSHDGRAIAFVLTHNEAYPEVYFAAGIEAIPEARPVTKLNAAFSQRPMPVVETISWPNGEGEMIEGTIYWPPGQRGVKNLPLVVDIHGGPWSARTEAITIDSPFAYYPALLASRGYLVLEPNYRGGTGRGDDFLHAIEGYSCSRPATDILSGVDHLLTQGWADPKRLGVMGYSYGGLLTSCLITRTDRFRAACSGAGIWNDISYFGTADNFSQNDARNLRKAPWEDFENYWRESAISGAGKIRTPTLVTIGGADRRVPTSQGFELYRALLRLGVPAELLVFPEEGHIFRKPSRKRAKVRAEMAWLDHYLLGTPMPKLQ